MTKGNTSLGLRAETRGFCWAIIAGTSEQPILCASGIKTAPAAYSEAESLTWLREQVIQTIEQHKPIHAAIRYPERTGFGEKRESTRARLRVEGVLLEATNSRSLNALTGALNTISKHIGGSAKDFLGSQDFHGLDLSEHKGHIPEAILAAVAALR